MIEMIVLIALGVCLGILLFVAIDKLAGGIDDRVWRWKERRKHKC